MTVDKQYENFPNNEGAKLKPTEEVNLKPAEESNVTSQTYSISKQNLNSLNKILITDDGSDESNKVLNYGVVLSKYSGAELQILRILENIEKMEDVSVQGSTEDNTSNNKDIKREIKGEIIDEMEKKIMRCKEAGCENKISYKFKVGDPIEGIISEVRDGGYDLIVLRSTNIDSWMKSLFSDTRKIISNISIPVLILQ